jgi:hypothetical protein
VPAWTAVPVALDEAYRPRPSLRGRSFLADVVWGQYCLFQCIRLQDDVFDGHSTDVALIYAADQFLIEAERTFAKHLPRSSRFWEVFRTSVESTTRAVVQVDELQKRVGARPSRLAREYARVGAIFKVGATAVCLAHRRTRDLAALGRFFDDVAAGDQILDDLEDVDADLRRGRFNYVAQKIFDRRSRVASDPARARHEVARALAAGDGADRVLDDARRRFARASVTAARLRVPAIVALAATARRSVDELKRGFHRAQVQRVTAAIGGR